MTEKTRRLTLLRELVVSGGVGAGQHLAIDDVVRVASDAGLRYSSRDNLYSDLDMLASEELVSCVKPGNADCILVTIRPKAIALVEEMTETESRGSRDALVARVALRPTTQASQGWPELGICNCLVRRNRLVAPSGRSSIRRIVS